jgi:hypothetical protein
VPASNLQACFQNFPVTKPSGDANTVSNIWSEVHSQAPDACKEAPSLEARLEARQDEQRIGEETDDWKKWRQEHPLTWRQAALARETPQQRAARLETKLKAQRVRRAARSANCRVERERQVAEQNAGNDEAAGAHGKVA